MFEKVGNLFDLVEALIREMKNQFLESLLHMGIQVSSRG